MATEKPKKKRFMFEIRADQTIPNRMIQIGVQSIENANMTVEVPVQIREIDAAAAKDADAGTLAADLKAAQERMTEMDQQIQDLEASKTELTEALAAADSGEAGEKIQQLTDALDASKEKVAELTEALEAKGDGGGDGTAAAELAELKADVLALKPGGKKDLEKLQAALK
jgi:chromosome segregation ATPase